MTQKRQNLFLEPKNEHLGACAVFLAAVPVLSYLGMNLLVFLQDMPVTERG